MSDYQPVIAVDFDGTIADNHYPYVGAPKRGVKEALDTLHAAGFYILIYSCRGSRWIADFPENSKEPCERFSFKEMLRFLKEHGIPYDGVDDGTIGGKPLADFYIDDKGVRFSDNWGDIVRAIMGGQLK